MATSFQIQEQIDIEFTIDTVPDPLDLKLRAWLLMCEVKFFLNGHSKGTAEMELRVGELIDAYFTKKQKTKLE